MSDHREGPPATPRPSGAPSPGREGYQAEHAPADPRPPAGAHSGVFSMANLRQLRDTLAAEYQPHLDARVDPVSGLLRAEQAVADAIGAVWVAWLALPVQHPDDTREVCDAVHAVQGKLMERVARRAFPCGWPVKSGGAADAAAKDWETEFILHGDDVSRETRP